MSTSRRRKAAVTEPPTSPRKKIKKDPEASNSNGCVNDPADQAEWEFQSGKNKWTKYTAEQNKEISEALKDSKTSVEIVQKKSTVVVNFEQMVQRNAKTGFEKRIRCLSSSDDNNEYVWQWNESKDKWTTYPQYTTTLLEAARALGMPSVSWTEQGKQITVDLNKCIQTKSGYKTSKKVKRIEADLADPPPVQKSVSGSAKTKPVAASKVKVEPPAKKVKKEVAAEAAEEEPAKLKSLVFTGKAPVDSHCPVKDKAHVFYEGSSCIWDTMLNQTNVQNNNNKYYLIQLLEDNVAKKYYVWMRWGRVGFDGQNNLQTCGADLGQAKKIFEKKFTDKTKNDWEDRDCFEKVPGKYDLLIMDYKASGNKDEVDAPKVKEEKPPVEPSKLDARVKALIELICNVQAMEEMLKEMKYDVNKAPLGKLTAEQIKAGYEALKNIESCINKNNFGQKLVKACNEFYTRVPHCFGMKRPPLIATEEEVKLKIQLLEALGDIQIAVTMLNEEVIDKEHPLDRHYKSLRCDMSPLDHTHDDFKMVEQYLLNTHAQTHNQYNMEVADVFAVQHQKENFVDVGNRMLLWHGSRLTNWAGILSQGLRIAPPEAPVTGYMFGKGIYFADMSSKSANYCFATRSKTVGLLLLSEVSLGKCNELLAANYTANDLPDGCQSVKALGKVAPNPEDTITRSDGVTVPVGKSADTNVKNPNGYTLNYNEYVVYNTNQVRMRYLVKVKFNFK